MGYKERGGEKSGNGTDKELNEKSGVPLTGGESSKQLDPFKKLTDKELNEK